MAGETSDRGWSGLDVLCDYRQVADTHSVCIVCGGLSLHALQPSWLKRLHSVVMMSLDHARFTVEQSLSVMRPSACIRRRIELHSVECHLHGLCGKGHSGSLSYDRHKRVYRVLKS